MCVMVLFYFISMPSNKLGSEGYGVIGQGYKRSDNGNPLCLNTFLPKIMKDNST